MKGLVVMGTYEVRTQHDGETHVLVVKANDAMNATLTAMVQEHCSRRSVRSVEFLRLLPVAA